MVLKVLLQFPPTLVLVHGWLFPENDLIPKRILAFGRPKWTKYCRFWSMLAWKVHCGLCRSPNRLPDQCSRSWAVSRVVWTPFCVLLWGWLTLTFSVGLPTKSPPQICTFTARIGIPTAWDKAQISQEKASAEIRGEFFRTKSRVNFAGDFWWIFFGPFSLEKMGGKIFGRGPESLKNISCSRATSRLHRGKSRLL